MRILQEDSASRSSPHSAPDSVDELAIFCKAAALDCGTGANPGQPVDPDLDALDIAKPLKGVVHVDDQIAHPRSDTLAYGRPAIGVASLLWGLGETCVDAGLGVYELWLCTRDGRCHHATAAVV
jgi:hypothetical protein